jgi:predicted nucleic acid-binding protein
MTCYVVDASIVVKWFVPEIYSEAAIRFLNGSDELIAPDLIFSEAGNALWKKVMRAEILPASAKEIIQNLMVSPVKLYPSGPMLEIALDISIEYRRSLYDSLYLALALSRRCPMVTADRRFFNSFKRSSLAGHLVWIED